MTRQEIEEFVLSFRQSQVLVLGDLILDEYLWGQTERISPEAPVQVVDIDREEIRLGGAGNVVHNLLALGAQVSVAGAVGDDSNGRELLQALNRMGVGVKGILTIPGRRTARKSRLIASNQQIVRIDRESREELSRSDEVALLNTVQGQLEGCQCILISDYLKGVLTPGVLQKTIELGKKHGIPVIVDPKGNDFSKYAGATLLTPNRREAHQATGIEIRSSGGVSRAGEHLLSTLKLEALVLTRSEEGMSLFQKGADELHLPTRAKEVFDVSGAGDTVLAAIGLSLACQHTLVQAVEIANLAAGVVVGKVGTSVVTGDELVQAAASGHMDSDLKIQPAARVAEILKIKADEGKTIVFTNGCFDLLHVGHVKYLQAARQLGDLLVLGLNTDRSIRALKGEKRPLIQQEERAHVLAALDCIDYVVLFDEETPLHLLETLRPDVLVKGADYSVEEVVGRELVESYGGRVELIQFVDGKSTTGLIEKILTSYQDQGEGGT